MIIRSMSLLVFGLWLANAAAAGPPRFYKWVDEQGQVHYSDTVPPAASGQERQVKSASGQTVQTIEPPPTRQQLEARQRAPDKATQAEHRRHAQEEYDRTLLLTFSSVQEIKTARDDRLRAVTAQIELIRQRLDKLQTRLREQRRKAVHIERTGQGDPTPVYAEIKQLQQHIDDNGTFIERKLGEQQRIRQEFARDMARYRELMAAREHQAHDPLNKP
jgi:hypothetical protein